MSPERQRVEEHAEKCKNHYNDTELFLQLLAMVYEDHPDTFSRITNCNVGRDRIYFSCREVEIERSGRNTNPQQIPGSGYWAYTGDNTQRKRDLVDCVLTVFGYSIDAKLAAKEAFDSIAKARQFMKGLL